MAAGSSPSEQRVPTQITAEDWPVQAADAIEKAVGAVRDATTGRAITAARALVYGMFALLVASAVLILLAISAVRFVDVYLPDAWVGEEHTWVAHTVIGGVFTLVGMVMWSRRRARGDGM